MVPRPRFLDLTAITICTLAWGTTWYVITFQLGVVDPVVSLTYRFALATALLFGWCGVRGLPVRLNFAQHAAACGVGLFTFGIDYTFIYLAEERISSAVVAVLFRDAVAREPRRVPGRVHAARTAARLVGSESGRRGGCHALLERDRNGPSRRQSPGRIWHGLYCHFGRIGGQTPSRVAVKS